MKPLTDIAMKIFTVLLIVASLAGCATSLPEITADKLPEPPRVQGEVDRRRTRRRAAARRMVEGVQ
jgi:hypothetical protein